MKIPRTFRWKWRYVTAKLYSLAVGRWIGRRLQGSRVAWQEARYGVLAIKLGDARSPPMKKALGDEAVDKLYNDLLQRFVNQGASRRMVGDDRDSQE